MTRIDVDTVRWRASGQWIDIISRLAPTLDDAVAHAGRHVPCPVHGGHDGFRLFRDCQATGGGICNSCGAFHDGFALLMWVNEWGFHDTLVAVAGAVGIDDRHTSSPPPRTALAPAPGRERDVAAATAALKRVWEETLDPNEGAAVPLRRYLQHRGIKVMPDPGVVRFHPGLGYYEQRQRLGTYPAIIAKICDPVGQPVSLHRIYLTQEGRKAPVGEPKKMMTPVGAVLGGAIRLFPACPLLGVTEGIETALAIRQRTDASVWAGVSARIMEHWMPPDGVDVVFIWADKDRSGTGAAAALRLQQRLAARGVTGIIHLPHGPIPDGAKSLDWLDVWRMQ